VSDQASVIIVGNRQRGAKEEKEEEMKERKPIAFSRYHHSRSFACLVSTSLLNSFFLSIFSF
jgi:hypothetical protein